jgi:hypothetical protein
LALLRLLLGGDKHEDVAIGLDRHVGGVMKRATRGHGRLGFGLRIDANQLTGWVGDEDISLGVERDTCGTIVRGVG